MATHDRGEAERPNAPGGCARERQASQRSERAQRLTAWSEHGLDALLASLKTGLEGWSDDEAHDRLVRYGANEVAHERPSHWAVQLVAAFRNPFILVLMILAGVSLLTEPKERKGSLSIGAMVAVSVVSRFVQEFRSTRAAEQLRAMVRTMATVVRRYPIAREISEQTARILGITHRQWRAERRQARATTAPHQSRSRGRWIGVFLVALLMVWSPGVQADDAPPVLFL
jgi:magnesium-transporting ATPase (P-type)